MINRDGIVLACSEEERNAAEESLRRIGLNVHSFDRWDDFVRAMQARRFILDTQTPVITDWNFPLNKDARYGQHLFHEVLAKAVVIVYSRSDLVSEPFLSNVKRRIRVRPDNSYAFKQDIQNALWEEKIYPDGSIGDVHSYGNLKDQKEKTVADSTPPDEIFMVTRQPAIEPNIRPYVEKILSENNIIVHSFADLADLRALAEKREIDLKNKAVILEDAIYDRGVLSIDAHNTDAFLSNAKAILIRANLEQPLDLEHAVNIPKVYWHKYNPNSGDILKYRDDLVRFRNDLLIDLKLFEVALSDITQPVTRYGILARIERQRIDSMLPKPETPGERQMRESAGRSACGRRSWGSSDVNAINLGGSTMLGKGMIARSNARILDAAIENAGTAMMARGLIMPGDMRGLERAKAQLKADTEAAIASGQPIPAEVKYEPRSNKLGARLVAGMQAQMRYKRAGLR